MPLSLEDRLNLQELLARYARAIDYAAEGKEQQFLDVFTADAVCDSPISGHNEGVAGLRNMYAKLVGTRDVVRNRHFITNPLIDGDGDRATIKAYFTEWIIGTRPLPPRTLAEPERLYTGSYNCEARKVDGTWRLSRRTVFVDGRGERDNY